MTTPRAVAEPGRGTGRARLRTLLLYGSLLAAVGLVVAVVGVRTRAQSASEAAARVACTPFDQQHGAWSELLGRYVRRGSVDYAGLSRAGRPALESYLRSLASVCHADYDSWTRSQKLAFWINAYNAFTVKLVLDHYPLESIRTIGLLPGAAFREAFIPLQSLRGQALSLNEIEHEILRGEFREPRIHFAIVCASKSCPGLRSEAYRATTLDSQLTEAARGFVSDTTKNRFDARTRTLRLSAIFSWFHEDFERGGGTVSAFVRRYAEPTTAAALLAGDVRVEYLDYDWSLNGK